MPSKAPVSWRSKAGTRTPISSARATANWMRAGLLGWICVLAPSVFAQPRLAKDPGPFLRPGDSESEAEARLQGKQPKAAPTPHLPDGRPDFGGKGAWYPGFSGNIAETKWKGVKSADKHVDVPFLPA